MNEPPNKRRTATYQRAPESRGQNIPYEEKFSALVELCANARIDGVETVAVAWAWVIGDTYEEVIESLSRIADAGLVLHVVERCEPGTTPLSKLSMN